MGSDCSKISAEDTKTDTTDCDKDDEKQELNILSPIFNEKDVNDWRVRGLLIPHEVIRHGLITLVDITNDKYYPLSNVDATQKIENKMTKFYTWCKKYFYFYVHHHHILFSMDH